MGERKKGKRKWMGAARKKGKIRQKSILTVKEKDRVLSKKRLKD